MERAVLHWVAGMGSVDLALCQACAVECTVIAVIVQAGNNIMFRMSGWLWAMQCTLGDRTLIRLASCGGEMHELLLFSSEYMHSAAAKRCCNDLNVFSFKWEARVFLNSWMLSWSAPLASWVSRSISTWCAGISGGTSTMIPHGFWFEGLWW